MRHTSPFAKSLALVPIIVVASLSNAAPRSTLSSLGIRTVLSDRNNTPLFLEQPGTNEIIRCVKKYGECSVMLPSQGGAVIRHYKKPKFSKAQVVFEDTPLSSDEWANNAWKNYRLLQNTLLEMRLFEKDFGAEIAEICGNEYAQLTNDIASKAVMFDGGTPDKSGNNALFEAQKQKMRQMILDDASDAEADDVGDFLRSEYDSHLQAIQNKVREKSFAENCRRRLREMDTFRSVHAATCALSEADVKSILVALDDIRINGAKKYPQAVTTLEARLIGYSDAILATLLAKPRIPFDMLFEQRAWMYARGELGDLSRSQNQVEPTMKQVFDLVVGKTNLVDRNLMLDFALGSYEGDETVAQWAIANLCDEDLKTVVRRGKVESAVFKAVLQIHADAPLVELSLDRSIPRKYREAVVAEILSRDSAGSLCREIYLNAEESWIAAKVLGEIDGDVLKQEDFVGKSLSWFRSADGAVDDRAKAYLAIPSAEDLSHPSDQHVLCTMLADSVERSRVFDKIVKDGSLTSGGEIRKLAAGDYDVDKKVVLWAVDRLGDEDLIAVIGKSSLPDVVFKSVRNLRSQASLAKVAIGDFGIVARIGAIERLEKESEGVLQKIARSNDANFRSVALKRLKTLGLSTKAAEEFIRNDDAAKEEERTREKKEHAAAIKAAKHEVELAKNDETIRRYVLSVKGGLAIGTELTFQGAVISVTSKNWKPKIRIVVKGANEALEVLCLVPGKFDLPVRVGSRVVVTGKFKSGTLTDVVLSDAVISLDGEAE